jgi:glycerol-3-phosphate dehydrogenase
VEKRDLNHGTTGRSHGLLHSGGRYAVKDPQSAAECIAENRILRRTHTHCIEDTGGFFVVAPGDEGDYPDKFKAACQRIGIPCEEIPVAEALRREPLLNPKASRVFQVPDGSADVFQTTHSTVQAARQAGAEILIYHEVVTLSMQDSRVVGARVRDMASGEEMDIHAAVTINAAGAWAGQIARTAGLTVDVIGGKGAILAFNHRIVNTVINRCKMPGDGDIIVPVHTVAVIGTTDQRVTDPELLTIEPWEVDTLMAEGEKLIPGIRHARVLRAWAGVRPLYQESYAGASRDATRAFTLLDHTTRDGVAGFLTIIGGKWTTFRLMAEKTVDKACEHLRVQRACVTATTPVPGIEQGNYWLGHRLYEVEEEHLQDELVCECELVTRAMLENAARNNPTLTLDDLRRDVRLGMGPCQGGFCTYRAAGILNEMDRKNTEYRVQNTENAWDVTHMQSPAHNAAHLEIENPKSKIQNLQSEIPNPNLLLRDFLQERWKGLTPILWGQQLKQERLDELIYLSLMNADHLPDEGLTSPMTEFYQAAPPEKETPSG